MRLWHEALIPYLPRQQLLGQHRECCALRGRGWGRPHATVNYVFNHHPALLFAYHYLIMEEMKHRGYHPDKIWYNPSYRGTTLGFDKNFIDDEKEVTDVKELLDNIHFIYDCIYPEHNDKYLQECLENLKQKGIDLYEKL